MTWDLMVMPLLQNWATLEPHCDRHIPKAQVKRGHTEFQRII